MDPPKLVYRFACETVWCPAPQVRNWYLTETMRISIGRAAWFAALGFGTIFLMSCTSTSKETPQSMSAKSRPFGKARNGDAVELYTLTNSKGMEATIMTYGGIVTSLRVPDRSGKLDDVVLGFDSIDGYLGDPPAPYFGALIGRYGN